MISNLVPLLLEAALRALFAAVAVWAGLSILRIGNVVVQKATWGLVLVAAIALPLAPRWQGLPISTALHLPTIQWSQAAAAEPAAPRIATPAPVVKPAAKAVEPAGLDSSAPGSRAPNSSALDSRGLDSPAPDSQALDSAALDSPVPEASDAPRASPPAGDRYPAPSISREEFTAPAQSAHEATAYTSTPVSAPERLAAKTSPSSIRPATMAMLLYLGVFAALLLRLLVGLASALHLWVTAEPVAALLNSDSSDNLRLRSSARVSSPVNIGSGIVLPTDFGEWDAEKLRVVLAHERSHVRQGDFYLQLLAALYASLFWFSPLGWWLKRKLNELSEAISDRAGLEEAASRSSYAQLLLEFAALPRPTLTGVAMARTSHLAQRIERLLNESSFRHAFAAGGRRALLAVLLVPVALVAATALVRVEAATPIVVALPSVQVAGQSAPEQVTSPGPAPAPTPASAPTPEPAPAAPGEVGSAPNAPMTPMPPMPEVGEAPQVPPMPPMPEVRVRIPHDEIRVHIDSQVRAEIAAAREQARAYRDMRYADDGDQYTLVGDPGSKSRFNGDWAGGDDRKAEIEKARKVAHGHFLWFRHDGKSYIVDDPSIVSDIEAMNKPMDELGEQMRTLGKQMRDFGQQQRELGKQMRDVTVPTPDLSKQMAELNAAVATLQSKQGGTISQKDLGDLQRQMGRIQGELGSLQGKIVAQQMKIDGGMGKFGEEQGKLGSQMGELGSKMGKIARENHTKVHGIIDESLKNGKAKPVE